MPFLGDDGDEGFATETNGEDGFLVFLGGPASAKHHSKKF